MMKTLMKALLTLTLTFGAAQANDTPFAGNGATLLPIRNDNITMVDEHIVLEAFDRRGPFEIGYWKATCVFHFKNETPEPQTITMGFPFQQQYETWFNPEKDWQKERKQYEPEMLKTYEQPLIRSFRTKVRGVDVKSKEIEIQDDRSPYKHAWVWDVTFAPGEQIEVINIYEHDDAINSTGDREILYVLKTGKNWKGGKIGRSLIEVKLKKDFILDFNHPQLITPKATRIEQDGKYKKIVWDLKNFTPETDLYFNYYPTSGEDEYIIFEDDIALNFEEELSKEETCRKLRMMRNTYYAWYGYPFRSADLREYFKKQWWYKEDPNFDVKKLPAKAQSILGYTSKAYKKLEKEHQCKK